MRKPFSLPGAAVLLALCSALLPTGRAQNGSQALVHDRVQPLAGRATIAHTVAPRALKAIDLGPAPANTALQAMTLRFSLTVAQNQALSTLEAAQQNPSSALYHQWLTPEQYGAQFGLSSNDLAQVTSWLGAQGFTNIHTARSRTFVSFSGTAAQAEAAFSTSIHSFQADGQNHIGNLTDAALPSAFASIITSVSGLDDFRPRPRVKVRTVPAPDPRFTSSVSGNTFIAPGDLYTIYNTNPLLNSSINGAGITIAVMGQTDIALTDIAAFRSASGLTANVPTIKVYGTDPGTSTADVPEASLDVEWSGAMAPAATILYVNSTNVVDGSLTQTIDNNLAPIVSISYGDCEADFGAATLLASYNQLFRQANVQGQTILGPAGDTGASDCDYGNTNGISTLGLAVDFPASSPYVTGVGGSEFNEAGGAYFGTTNGAFQGSALSYIPEMVWNDDAAGGGLAATGGGASSFFVKPPYQVGTGVPNDFSRDVPDLALTASANHDGYLFCASGFCTNGFRNASQNLDVVGGTSASTPSFAGIMALLEQKIQARVGNANPVIYGLANSTYYSTVFHDITVGTNASACVANTVGCPTGSIGFAAGVGYDQATGWGSVNAANMVADWLLVQPAGASVNQGFNTPSVTITPASTSVSAGSPDSLRITVASATTGLTTVPTGSVQLLVDGVASGPSVALVAGAATLSAPTTGLASGAHTVTVVYTGDGTYTGAKGSFTLDVVSATVPDFALSPATASLTVSRGANSSGVTYTVTPVNGFVGTVTFTATEPTGALSGSYQFTPQTVTLSSASALTSVFTFSAYTAAAKPGSGMIQLNPTRAALKPAPAPWKLAGTGLALAGLGFLVLPRRRRRWGALLAALLSIGILTVSGCGDNGAPSNINSAPGNYVITITATSTTSTGTYTHNSILNLTIQ